MSEIKFACPHCAQPLEAPPDLGGSEIACPQCERRIAVPHSTAQASAHHPAQVIGTQDSTTYAQRKENSSSHKAWQIVLWSGIGLIVLFGVFQPACEGKWWWGHSDYRNGEFYLYGPDKWHFVPIFTGLLDSTVPFLVRIALATGILVIGFLPVLRLNARQRRVLVAGTLLAFGLSLFEYGERVLYPIFSDSFDYRPTAKFLVGLAAFISLALLLSLHNWKKGFGK